MKKDIMITGGTGYIGSKLAESLCESYNITLLIRSNSKNKERVKSLKRVKIIEYCSYSDFDNIFKKNKQDCLIHLANTFKGNLEETIESNISFPSQLLLSYCQNQQNPSFLNTSSFFLYNEKGEYNPSSFYIATKKAFEDILIFFIKEKGLNSMSLILYDIYGIDDWRGKIFNTIINSLESGVPLNLSSEEIFINLTSIDDIIEGYKKAILILLDKEYQEKKEFKKYHIFSSETIKLKTLVEILEKAINKKTKVNWNIYQKEKNRSEEKCIAQGEILPFWKNQFLLKTYMDKYYLK